MTLTPDPWWLALILAVVVLADAAISIRPPRFVRDCLLGVQFPREWWWTLIVIKALAGAGLLAGIWIPGVALAANVGVVVYFLCASYAHIRVRFLTQVFWVNCLGMLTLSLLTLVFGFLV